MQIIYRKSKKLVNELEQGRFFDSAKATLQSPNHSLPHCRIPSGVRILYLPPSDE